MTVKKNNKVSLESFLSKFPEINLPVVLSSDTHLTFSKKNELLHTLHIEQFIEIIEGKETDEFTEFIPCFSIPQTKDFHAVVYFKAGLLDYYYVLATFSKWGELIDKKVIAGTFSDGKNIAQSVATIDEDWTIHVVTGQSDPNESYDAAQSTAFELEILPNGSIADDRTN
jgi:hypothetical protein